MSIVRVNKTSNYTVLSNFHFKEKKMSLKAKGLLSLMLSLPDDWNYSISGLVTLSKDGKDSVMSTLVELEKFGYLRRKRLTNSKGQFAGTEYNIFEEPQPQEPVAEKPTEGNENAGKPISGNQKLLNTNSIKNLFNKNTNELNTNEISPEMEVILFRLVPNNSLRDLYKDYIQMRASIEAPLTDSGLKMLIQRCERLSSNSIEKQKILLEAATINGWKNVYSPKDNDAPASIRENDAYRKLYEFYGND